jgi:serpin B
MDIQAIIAIVCVTLGISLSHAQTSAAASNQHDEQKRAVAAANNAFASAVYNQIKANPGNLVFSPYSLYTVLSMASAGARRNTEAQMTDALHVPFEAPQIHEALHAWNQALKSSEQEGYQLSSANALWTQEGQELLAQFTELLHTFYDAQLTALDFAQAPQQAIDTINAWVRQQTQNKISELIAPENIPQGLALILTNAIYFKGTWQTPFDEERTQEAAFTLREGTQVNVPMMRQMTSVLYGEDQLMQVIELPYMHSEHGAPLSLGVLLPKDPAAFADCETALSAEYLDTLFAALRPQKVAISLPRFHVYGAFSLPDTLRALGMTDAFSLPPADFSGITGTQDLYIAEVLHKVMLDVNEKGTEAAGVSAVMMSRGLSQPLLFEADHPFWVMIRDTTTGGILFWGRIMDPR